MRPPPLLILCAVFGVGCGTVYPIHPKSAPYARMPAPVLPEASLHGPIVEGSRIAGWSYFDYGSAAVAMAGNPSGYAAAAARSRATAATVAFEHYESADVQEFLRKLLEDTGTVTRIFPGAAWEIRGSGGSSSLSCPACVVYNNLMIFTLVAFAGVPLFGTREASVELRIYRDHEFLKSYVGYGECGAFGTLYYALWNGMTREQGGGTLAACATALAVAGAVRKLQSDPPTDRAATP